MGTANKYQPDPHTARLAKLTKRREALQPIAEALDKALTTSTALLDSPDDNTKLRAVHAVTQCANTYARIYEVGELEYRVAQLETNGGRLDLSGVPTEEIERMTRYIEEIEKRDADTFSRIPLDKLEAIDKILDSVE